MAIDSQNKRMSIINISLPFRGLLPIPDGTVGQGDRYQLLNLYRSEDSEISPGGNNNGKRGWSRPHWGSPTFWRVN
jgi:hypothetical protein